MIYLNDFSVDNCGNSSANTWYNIYILCVFGGYFYEIKIYT